MIEWSAIRDDGFDTIGGGGWNSPQAVINSALERARTYERDHQEGQPHFTEIWVEAAGMMPQVEQMVSEYSVPVYSSGGFNSTTSKYESARRIWDRWLEQQRPTWVLHVGDHDPSGVAIIDSLADDIGAFLEDMGDVYQEAADFARLAITPDQIDELRLPGAPAKRTDQRAGFTDLTVQAEALSPPQLEAIVLEAVDQQWDVDAYDTLLATESNERAQLIEAFENIEVTQ
jgi:hypothetical protein